jgi:hypothetical protein
MWETREVLVWRSDGKRPFGRPRRKLEHNYINNNNKIRSN